jgi:hypothetical protein
MHIEPTLILDDWGWGLGSYFFCHFLHLVIWRRRQPVHDVVILFSLLFFIPGFLYLAAGFYRGPTLVFAPLMTHLVIAANYIAFYPAIQARSPTLRILNVLREKPLTEIEIASALTDSSQFSDRLQDLVTGGLLIPQGGTFVATSRGRRLADFFRGYRRFIGLPPGEG